MKKSSFNENQTTRITFGNQLHGFYISETDSKLIEDLVRLPPSNKIEDSSADCIEYIVSPVNIYPRNTDGVKSEYLFRVSTDGDITNIIHYHIARSRVINIETPRKRTDFDRVTVERIDCKLNAFNLQQNNSLEQVYVKSGSRVYEFIYDNFTWYIKFNYLYGNPHRFVDDNEYLHFIDKPKYQCTLYGPIHVPYHTVKKLVTAILPSIYKVK